MTFKDKMDKVWKSITTPASVSWAREYDFYLFFCKTENGQYPWNRDVWNNHIQPVIDKIITNSPHYKDTALKVFKYEKPNDIEYYKEVKSGRLRWNSKSHDKWTISDKEDIYFGSMELWTPIWTECDKKQLPPDIFLKIENEEFNYKHKELQFNIFVILAVARDLNIHCNETIAELSEALFSLQTVCQLRRWDKPKTDKEKNWTFSNWVQDTTSNGIYRNKGLHNFDFNDIVFEEPFWQTIYRKEEDI